MTPDREQLIAALQRRDPAALAAQVQAHLDAGVPLGREWAPLARAMIADGEATLAIAAAAAAAAEVADPAMPLLHARTLALFGRLDAAAEIARTGPAADPDWRYLRATLALNRGDMAAAAEELRALTRQVPDSGAVWLALAQAIGEDGDADDAAIEAAAVRIAAAGGENAGQAWFAAGIRRHQRGAHAQAFDAFARGNACRAEARRFDPVVAEDRAARALVMGAEAIAALGAARAPGTSRAILVTGMPRSGTTLVEQMLVAHPAVGGGSETAIPGIMLRHTGADGIAALSPDRVAALGRLHAHLIDERFPARGRVVDKSLSLGPALPLLLAVTDAPVVWLRRDPLDTAWSCFRNWFAAGAAWAGRLDHIAAQMRIEDRLHAHWSAACPDRILTLDYRALVEAPEASVRRLLAHVELDWDPAVLAPERQVRAVVTNSFAQVRAPINRAGLGVAAPYRQQLQPFLDAYTAA